jgi:hypothetical protein
MKIRRLSTALIAAVWASAAGGAPQDTRPGVIRAAVRVFDGGTFVSGLRLEDFEVLENGRPRPIRSLYLVAGDAVLKSEGSGFQPFVGRRFTLMFQMSEYHPKLAEAIREFIARELRAGDTLDVQTPMGSYQLDAQALAARSRKAVADRLIEIVRTDITAGGTAYNSLLNELKKLVRSIGGANAMEALETDAETESFSPELLLPRYRAILQNLDGLRKIDVDLFERYARALKTLRGQKHVLCFYQREYQPEIDPQVLNELFTANQDKANILGDLQELFQSYKRGFAQDDARLARAFADSGASFSLLFLNKSPERIARIVMREQSEDIFRLLADIAKATGGVVETSQNPAAGMASALKILERAYLLEFVSQDEGNSFKSLSVSVKGRSYRVIHRQGFFD